MISDIELGWIAGLLEGEGCFRVHSSCKRSILVKLQMTDEDTVHRFSEVVEKITGRYYPPKAYPQTKGQQIYGVEICGEPSRKIMKLVVRYMSFRRRQRIWQCLNGYTPKKAKLPENFLSNIVQLQRKA